MAASLGGTTSRTTQRLVNSILTRDRNSRTTLTVGKAQRYKDYNKVRDILSGKIPPPSSKQDAGPKKRKPDPLPAETPLKQTKYAETPSKERIHDEDLMNTPAISRKLFSPAPVTSLGPTPQRDGRVLGLFDLLVEKELGTPSKDNSNSTDGVERASASIQATPSKRTGLLDPESAKKLGRTPMSASKRQMLNTYTTPMKNRRGTIDANTPSSVSKLQFDTPAFLKRHSLPALDENAMFADPAPLRLPRKSLVRGLSEIVACLRKVEEDALDDDLDALRELEDQEMNYGGGETSSNNRPPSPTLSMRDEPINHAVKDSQVERPRLLGGFDDENMFDAPELDSVDHNGNPLGPIKKKGQKRTTRRVKMRPIRTKRPDTVDYCSDSDPDTEDVVPETQVGAAEVGVQLANGASDTEWEDEGSHSKKPKSVPVSKPKKVGPIKKVARKVNELAHANFHRLKLRNNGAKGGPGYNSKFRRRR